MRDSSKALLDHVNTAIKECENQQYLIDISKKIDKGPLERSNNEIVKEYKVRVIMKILVVHCNLANLPRVADFSWRNTNVTVC